MKDKPAGAAERDLPLLNRPTINRHNGSSLRMRIDAFNHFFPRSLFRQAAGERPARHRQARHRMCRRCTISTRRKIIDSFPGLRAGDFARRARAESFRRSRDRDRIRQDRQRRHGELVRRSIRTSFPASSPTCRSPRRMPASPNASAPSTSSAPSACRFSPTSTASRSTGPEYQPFWAAHAQARQADLGASGAWRQPPRLYQREEIAIRNLVDLRLAVGNRRVHGAHGVLEDLDKHPD